MAFSLETAALLTSTEKIKKDDVTQAINYQLYNDTIIRENLNKLVEIEKRKARFQALINYIDENKSIKSNIGSEYLAEMIFQYSEMFNLEPELLACMIKAESNFYPYAKSYMDCRGLGQASKATWDWFNVDYVWPKYNDVWSFEEDVYDDQKNLQFICWYINKLREYEYIDNDYKMLIAYNCGPYHTNVSNHDNWAYSKRILADIDSLIN